VFDRNWNAIGDVFMGAIAIRANDVTLDLQGFELAADYVGIYIYSPDATIRNGRINTARIGGAAILARAPRATIDRIRATTGHGQVIELTGAESILTNSVVTNLADGVGVAAGNSTTVRNNRISSPSDQAIQLVGSNATIADNSLACGVFYPCIDIEGVNNTVSYNRLSAASGSQAGISVRGDYNFVLANVVMGCGGITAMVVDGQWNAIRDNLVPGCGLTSGWQTGVLFRRDGNFYGDNTVWALTPFNVGATVQTNLGGNNGFGQ
jgi:hypothetical protein